eukprot:12318909-Alexandrium_andersonii.AAC.1
MDYAMRHEGLPSHSLWEVLAPAGPCLRVHEDSQATMAIVKSGRNPTMRYLHRTQHASVQWSRGRFSDPEGAPV